MTKFSDIGLSTTTVEVLSTIGFETPTPIQEQAIPLLLHKSPTDFIGMAQTGTGKTAAFGLPLIDLIDTFSHKTQALVLAPTRELSQQSAKQLKEFTANRKEINIEVVYGGAAISNQIRALKKPVHIIVATPGRLLDLMKRKSIDLSALEYLVLDEADEMLNMGFKEDIDEILESAGTNRSIWLFSATMPKEIRKIVNTYMTNPEEVSVMSKDQTNQDIEHQYVITKTANKVAAIRRFLDIMPEMRGVMFCRTRRETQKIAEDLAALGYGVEALHGELSQAQRDNVMRRFKARSMQLLIATDVAARGIDVSELSHVLHHTLPDQLEYYTHRSGRTGRAGKKGVSIAFINPRENRRIVEIEKKIKVKFKHVEVPSAEEIRNSRMNNWANLILNTKVDERSADILANLHGQFAHLSKDELLRRLITTQLDHFRVQNGEDDDLNELAGGHNKDKTTTQSRDGFNRYFINLGMIDGITKGDLLHFLSDISGIRRKAFGDIDLQKNFAFFEVDSTRDDKLEASFLGISVEGREIRVNLENSGKSAQTLRKSTASSHRSRKSAKHSVKRKPNKGRRGRRY